MRAYGALIIAFVPGIFPRAQAQYLDSLYAVWQDPTRSDSIRVAAYTDYIWDGYLYSRPDTAAILAEALHAFALERKYPRASAKGYNLQGTASRLQGDHPRAFQYYKKSLAIHERIGEKKGIAGNLNNIGLIYREQARNDQALDYYLRSRSIFEEIGDKQGLGNSLNNIGSIYTDERDFLRALEYMEQGTAIQKEVGNEKGLANGLGNIGVVYGEKGDTARALEYFEKSLAIREAIGDRVGIAVSLSNLAVIYGGQGDRTRALEYHRKSLAMREELGDKGGLSMSLHNIGLLYQSQGRNDLAISYCQRSLALAEEIGSWDLQKTACKCHYEAYKAMGKGNEALVYLEKMRVVEDSLNAQQTSKKLEQMEFAKVLLQDSIAAAEAARLVQEAHNEEMRGEARTRNIAIGVGVLVLLLAGSIYARLRYVRKAKAALQVEKDRSEDLLLNILPADIAAELKEKGRADARDFDRVSILFTDFKGFTTASEKLSAQELVGEINTCFEAFDGIVGKYGVEKIKTIGDAYMVAGGLPGTRPDHVIAIARLALEMRAYLAARGDGLTMRIGIHTGPVVAGVIGKRKFAFDLWGDTVNTAARMESHGEPGRIQISDAVALLLGGDLQVEERGVIDVKGKGPMRTWWLEGP